MEFTPLALAPNSVFAQQRNLLNSTFMCTFCCQFLAYFSLEEIHVDQVVFLLQILRLCNSVGGLIKSGLSVECFKTLTTKSYL